jgi:predicted metal-dependent phosphoesterase TrpH
MIVSGTETMVDFHIHSILSDGFMRPDKVIMKAAASGIKVAALTDHNYVNDYSDELRERYGTRIQLVNGIELSTEYVRSDGGKTEVHIVGLGFKNEGIREAVKKNRQDRRGYFNAMVEKLRVNCGIEIPSYDTFKRLYPESRHLGRIHITDYMLKHGIISSFDEGFDKYVGTYGERRAYVNSLDHMHFMSVAEGAELIKKAGGIPVLAHLFSYNLSMREQMRLVQMFSGHAGPDAALEVFYGRYSPEKQKLLKDIADDWNLLYSSGSDYHAKTLYERLMDPDHLSGTDLNRHVLSRLISRGIVRDLNLLG